MDITALKAELERVAAEHTQIDDSPYLEGQSDFAQRLLDTFFKEDACEWEKAVETIFNKCVVPYQKFMNDAWIPLFLGLLINETGVIENIRKLPNDEAREYLRLFTAEAARQIQKKWNALAPEDSK